jgi:sugar lactone lactonase YvrE
LKNHDECPHVRGYFPVEKQCPAKEKVEMTKLPLCALFPCLLCSVGLGQTWSALPVDLVVPMNTSTPGTTLTESIMNAGTVYGASCDAGANCSWGPPATGAFTVAADQEGLANLGPVAVNGGTTYAANALSYNSVAYNTDIAGPGTVVTLDIGGGPGTATSVSGLVGLTTPPIEPESASNIDMFIFYSTNGDYAVTQFNPHCTGDTYGVWIEVKPTARSSCISVLPQTNYYFAMYYNFTSGLATLYVYNPNGTLFGSTSITSGDIGGTLSQVRFGNDESGFAPGTSYFQNLMLNWTTAPNPMFWTAGSVLSFGPVPVGTPAPTQTLTYNFTSETTLTSVDVLTAGAAGLDYTNAGTGTCAAGVYIAGQSCTVAVAFTPAAPGARAGAVTLFAQGSNLPLMTWYLSGIGQSGAVTIDPGTQSTIALAGTPAGYGSTVDGAGNIYVVDHANGQVIKLAAGSFTQSTVLAGLSDPTAVAADGAANLYISDTGNHRVVKVPNENGTLNGNDMSVVSIAGLSSAAWVATDDSGNLYVSDPTNGDVVSVPPGGGTVETVASGLTNPSGVAVDAGGNVYVAANNAVTEYPFGGGTPLPMGSGYNDPSGLAVNAAGTLYVADTGNGRIVEVTAGGASQSILPIVQGVDPQGVSLDSAGDVYFTGGSGEVFEVNRTQAAGLVFPTTGTNTTSPAQTVTITNAGNQQLILSNLAVTGNFTQNASGGTDCSSTSNVSPGSQCLIAVAFAPTQTGTLAGTVTLTDNSLNASSTSQTIALSGTGGQAQAATPTFSPAAGTYTSAQTVSISDTTTGAAIYYTTNGATPTTSSAQYTAAITVSSTETIKAIAVATGFANSAVGPAAYTINLPTAAMPTFSPAAGTYKSAQRVTISDTTTGAAIYYTTNGTTPTTNSAQYTAPITVSSTETIKAIAIATGFANSAVGSAAYTINLPTAATPTFSPAAGTYKSAQRVTISDRTTGAAIYYTTNGTTPTTGSTQYTAPITVSSTETIKAIAVATGYANSAVGSAKYSIK